MNELLAAFFQHNRWANLRLLDRCATLDDAVLAANAVGGYGSLADTLLHLAAAEQRYATRLGCAPPALPLCERDPFPGVAALRAAAEQSGAALIARAEQSLTDTQLHEEHDGERLVIPLSVRLLQAINHATEHRTQVNAILTQQGIEPPALDGWAFMGFQ